MSVNPKGPAKGSGHLSPDELAQEVARHLRHGEHVEHRRPFDIVSLSRIGAVVGLLLLGVGVAVAAPWVGRLAGYETAGVVVAAAPITGCPGEPELGRLILGDRVQVVGVDEDARFVVLRDPRGPGNLVYVDAGAIGDVAEPEKLPVRTCQPREEADLLAAPNLTAPSVASTTTVPVTVTSQAVEVSPTTTSPALLISRPARRGASTAYQAPSTSSPTATTTPSDEPTPPTTEFAGASPTTSGTTPTTPPPATPTTSQATTTTSAPAPTTTTTASTTTTVESTTTSTEPETTTVP